MDRKLTDDDIKELVDQLETRALERLQTNVGKGVISILKTWSIRVILLLAAYGLGVSGGEIKKLLGW